MLNMMTREDLGGGFALVYQNGQSGYRAVVKGPDGAIVARGPVVPEHQIKRSRFVAVAEWMETRFPEPVPVPDPDLFDENDEDGDDDDEEDDEE